MRQDACGLVRCKPASKAELLPGFGHFLIRGELASVRLGDGEPQILNLLISQLILRSAASQREKYFASQVLAFRRELPHRLNSTFEQFCHTTNVAWIERKR